jgi:redox-sensitive bicupin YhaK (pirin superfamily)
VIPTYAQGLAGSIAMKTVARILTSQGGHWVGDGFPVRSLFSYDRDAQENSPFLLFDYAGPYHFPPALTPRGVGQHPHRGFETVTIAYEGEVAHRDSTGGGGTIRPGDVQWMTAAGGILHEEFHSPAFTKTGGPFRMVQLWVNLPAKHKMTKAGYQAIASADIPVVALPGGTARIIAGQLGEARGPARTFSPINLWDVRLVAGAEVTLDLPEDHTAMVAVLSGHVTAGGTDKSRGAGEAEILRFTREGAGAMLRADAQSVLLVMTGEPLGEPVVGHGPFVMTSPAEIHQAISDFNSGKFGGA